MIKSLVGLPSIKNEYDMMQFQQKYSIRLSRYFKVLNKLYLTKMKIKFMYHFIGSRKCKFSFDETDPSETKIKASFTGNFLLSNVTKYDKLYFVLEHPF